MTAERPGSATGRITQDFMMHDDSTAERTPGSLHPAGYAALAEKAYVHGRSVALKANGNGYNRSWAETPEPTRKGFVAMVRFIAKELKRHNEKGQP